MTSLCDSGPIYAIATSTRTSKARDHLTPAGLGDLFPVIIGGDQVGHGKPAPDIDLEAARRLRQNPTDCAAFEDSENGVRAALAAGVTTVQIPDRKQPSARFLANGHLVAPDLIAGVRLLGPSDV